MTKPAEKASKTGHILVDHLRVRFGGDAAAVEAVSDVSMEVKPGDFVSIIGPSGCGKSTLLNVVAGFVKPSEGGVTVDGRPESRKTAKIRAGQAVECRGVRLIVRAK